MNPTTKKIQDTARRIYRLGRYVSTTRVTKDKGVLTMRLGISFAAMCELNTGRVWMQGAQIELEQPLEWMLQYEAELLGQAKAKAQEEVLDELVNRRIRRVLRTKTKSVGKARQTV